jgi:hypothetical protein
MQFSHLFSARRARRSHRDAASVCRRRAYRHHLGCERLEDRRLLTTHFVNDDVVGGDGSSWASAFNDLQDALATATAGDEIWVAAGTYKPTTDGNREISFNLESGVSLYGGFAGTETDLDERDWEVNSTVLSGDIGVPGSVVDNSYHVVYASGITGVTLDGLTITGGNQRLAKTR